MRFTTAMLALAALACLPGLALADFQDEFTSGTLDPSWNLRDGYAVQYPADTANHASFQMTGTHLSVAFPGGFDHNQWWLRHAQATRTYPGSGVYEIKVHSSITGSQQFGIVFENSPGTFMMFMVYATDQVHAYIERFAKTSDLQYKTTVYGTTLAGSVPDAGPYYLRVSVEDDPVPANRVWGFQWSRDGTNWTSLFSGVLEGTSAYERVNTLQQVGLFSGNQPDGFDGFNAQFDYFRFVGDAPVPPGVPDNLTARGGDGVVNLWWAAVTDAVSYSIYRRPTSGGTFTSVGTSSTPAFDDASAVNGTSYTYAVTAHKNGGESEMSATVQAVPHISEMQGLPSTGLVLALNAKELQYVTANGAHIHRWVNAIGPKVAATAVGNTAPHFVTSGVGGQPAVRFDGVNDFISLPSSGFENFTAGMSLYVVMRPTVLQSGFKIVSLGNGAAQQNIVLGRAGSTAGLQYFTDNTSGNVQWFNTPDGLSAGESMLISVHQESGAANTLSFAEVGRDGVALNGQNVWVPPVASRGVNYLGKSFWEEGLLQGDVAEVLLYNRILTAGEQATVESYIAQKYGIDVDGTGEPPPPPPPAPLASPANVSAAAADSTVTVNWSAVTDATGYRVHRSSVPVGGFSQIADITTVSYADNTVTNGTTYRYVVTAYNTSEESATSAEVSATPTTPPPPGAGLPVEGLILSLDAQSALTQYGEGGSVSSWMDSSPYSHHAIVTGGGAPTVHSNAVGGKPAVRFDGADDFLALPTSGFDNFTAGISLYVVMKPTVLQSGFKILAMGNGPGQQNIVLGRAGSTSGLQYFTDNAYGSVQWFNTADGLVAGQASLISMLQAGGAANSLAGAQVHKNGTTLGGNDVWVPPVTQRSVNYIGKSYWPEGLLQGDVAEIVMYNRQLTPTEQNDVKSYITTKYGITIQ